MNRFLRRLPSLISARTRGADRIAREVEAELESHLALKTELHVNAGLQPEEARARAVSEFGDLRRIAGACRTVRGSSTWVTVRAGGSLITIVTLATIALATMALLVDSTVLRPLPEVTDHGLLELRTVWRRNGNESRGAVSVPDFESWRGAASLGPAALFYIDSLPVSRPRATSTVRVATVSAEFFDVLDVDAAWGRLLGDRASDATAPAPAVVSKGYWKRELRDSGATLGHHLVVNGRRHEIVGVLPPEATRRYGLDVAIPMVSSATDAWRTYRLYSAVARLAPGAELRHAQRELSQISERLARLYPRDNRYVAAAVEPVNSSASRPVRAVWFLAATLSIVLLSMVLRLARRTGREFGYGLELSAASRGRDALPHALTSWLVPSIAAAAVGIVLARRGIAALVDALLPYASHLYRLQVDALLLVGTAPLAFGVLAIAWRGAQAGDGRHDPGERSSGRWGATRGVRLAIASTLGFIVIAMAVTALENAWTVARANVGYEPAGIAVARIKLPDARYPGDDDKRRLVHDLLNRLRASPDVKTVGVTEAVPPAGATSVRTMAVLADGEGHDPDGLKLRGADIVRVDRGFIDLIGARLLAGRVLDPSPSAREVLVNQAFADEFWPGEGAVGHTVRIGGSGPWYEVAGVLEDSFLQGPSRRARAAIFPSFDETPVGEFSIVARGFDGRAPVEALVAAIRRTDRSIATDRVQTAEGLVDSSLRRPRTIAWSTGLVGLALLLLLVCAGYETTSASERGTLGRSSVTALPVVLGLALGAVWAPGLIAWLQHSMRLTLAAPGRTLWIAGGSVLLAAMLGAGASLSRPPDSRPAVRFVPFEGRES